MSNCLQSVKSRLTEIASQITRGYSEEFTIPIAFEELQALKSAIRRAKQELHEPPDSAYLELAEQLVEDVVRRLGELDRQDARIFQFKIRLSESQNEIWRRIQVEDDRLREFRNHLLAITNWNEEWESFGLRFNGQDYVYVDEVRFDEINMEGVGLSEALGDGRPPAWHELSHLGDAWLDLIFEGRCDRDEGQHYPRILEGAGTFPSLKEMQVRQAEKEELFGVEPALRPQRRHVLVRADHGLSGVIKP